MSGFIDVSGFTDFAALPWFNAAIAGALTKPSTSDFTLLQSTSLGGQATLADMASRGTTLLVPNVGANPNLALMAQPVPSQSVFTVTMFLNLWGFVSSNNWAFGPFVSDTAGRIVLLGMYASVSNAQVIYARYTNINTLSGTTGGGPGNAQYGKTKVVPQWHRLTLSGGNFIQSISLDGENFVGIQTRAANDFLAGVGSLANFGILCDNSTSNGQSQRLNCYSYKVT